MNITHQRLPTFKTILAATDLSTSPSVLAVAARIAASLRARLLILHVFEHADAALASAGGIASGLEELVREAKDRLSALRHSMEKIGLEVETIFEYGIASLTIMDVIADRNVDLVVIGTKGYRGLERGLFGSTAETVLRKAHCPVITVGPHVRELTAKRQKTSPIVFATDFNAASSQVIRYAISLCQQMAAPLHCLDVLPQSMAETDKGNIVPPILTEALEHMVYESGSFLENHPVYALTYGNDIPDAIVNYGKQQNASLIILAAKRASAIASHLPAHIVYGVIAKSECPVLTLSLE
jgi:nucleotide-binding universal stress UspA family protein